MNICKIAKRILVGVGITALVLVVAFYASLLIFVAPEFGWDRSINRIRDLPGLHEILNGYREDIDFSRSQIRGHRPERSSVYISIRFNNDIDADTIEELQYKLLKYFESVEFLDWIENHRWFEPWRDRVLVSLSFRGLSGGPIFYHREIQLN